MRQLLSRRPDLQAGCFGGEMWPLPWGEPERTPVVKRSFCSLLTVTLNNHVVHFLRGVSSLCSRGDMAGAGF